jgi:hypothetical protein
MASFGSTLAIEQQQKKPLKASESGQTQKNASEQRYVKLSELEKMTPAKPRQGQKLTRLIGRLT